MLYALYQPQILTSIKLWYHMMSCDNVTARYLNNFLMDFLKIVNSSIIFIAQVISPKNIPHRSNCHKMKRKIYHTVRTVIKWKTKHSTPFRTVIKCKTKYTTPFELSSNEKKNIPHSSNCHKMKNKICNTWKNHSLRLVWNTNIF